MELVSFCTAVTYFGPKSRSDRFAEAAEDYFHLSGKKAVVFPWKPGFLSQETELYSIPSNRAARIALIALKLFSYLTVVIPLFMLVVKGIFRGRHFFHYIPKKEWLESKTVKKVQSLMEQIIDFEESEEFSFYQSQRHHRIFSLKGAPHLIFKMVPDFDQEIKARYKKSLSALSIWLKHQFDLLVLPRTELFQVAHQGKRYTIIAEEKLPIESDEGVQDRFYREHPKKLAPALKQLTRFVCKMRLSDVERRNCPLILKNHVVRLALIDMEETESADIGLFGDDGLYVRSGLIPLSPRGQKRALVEVAKQELRWTEGRQQKAEKVLKDELREQEKEEKLLQVYQERGIVKGDEPVAVDDLKQQFPLKKQRNLVEQFIAQINQQLAESDHTLPIWERRQLLINSNHPPFTSGVLKSLIESLTGEGLPIIELVERSPAGFLIQI